MVTVEEYLACCDSALDGLTAIAETLGDDLVGTRLEDVPGSNTAYGVVTHCLGVMAWWARAVNRGLPVARDREAEFDAAGTVAELLDAVRAGRARFHDDVAAADPGAPAASAPYPGGPVPTQGAVLLHVYEELAQHLGQLEVTRDVLLSRAG